jgi:hypothetical protein
LTRTSSWHGKRRAILGAVAWCALVLGLAPGLARADKVDDLVRQLKSEPDYKVRLSAAINLGKIGDKRAVPSFIDALTDADKTVRGVSAAALGKLVDSAVDRPVRDRALGELARVAKSDADAFVRSQAQKSFDALKGLSETGGGGKAVYVEIGPMADTSKQGGPTFLPMMQDTVAKTIRKKAPHYLTKWPSGKSPSKAELSRAGTPAAFYLDGTLTTMDVKTKGSLAEVSCNVSLLLATFPEKSMFAFVKGAAQVQTGTTEKQLDEAKQDCVGAVLENLVERQVMPTIQAKVP